MSIIIRFLDRITGYGIEQGIEVHVDSGQDDGDSRSVLPCWRVVDCGLSDLRGIDRVSEKPVHLSKEA